MKNRYEVWTKVNDDGDRVYIGVQLDSDERVVAATNAYETAEAARDGMYFYGSHGQTRWVVQNRASFTAVRS